MVAILTGVLMALSSAPYDQWYLAYVAFVPLFVVTQNLSPLKQGLLFALSCTVIAVNWWHSTIIFSALFFIFIVVVLSFAFFLWGVLSARFRAEATHPLFALFMPALIWVGIERILSSEWVGIPCNIGITQTSQPLLIQSASFFGFYTISFLIVLSNSALALLISSWKKNQFTKLRAVTIATAVFIMAANIGYGYHQLSQPVNLDNPVNVAIIQPVISSQLYNNGWRNPESRTFIRETLNNLTQKALVSKPDILVWPEGGNGYFNLRIKNLRDNLYQLARKNKTDLLISSNDLDEEGRKYNTIFSISSEGRLLGRYNKVNLIPGAEDSYTAGTGFHTIPSSYGEVGPSICYESNFPSPLRKVTNKGAELLVVSTSDAAFKKTSLTINHTRTAVFRAVENNRWVVHASNTGPSVIVSPTGQVVASIGFYQRGYVSGQVAYIQKKSFFTQYGHFIPVLFSVVVLVLLVMLVAKTWKEVTEQRSRTKNSPTEKKETYEQKIKSWISHFFKHYLPFSVFYSLFLVLFMISSIMITYRQAPDPGSVYDALDDFFTPLDERAPDRIGKKFLQVQNNTCGPAVLAYIFSFFGLEVVEADLVPKLAISAKGTSMLELKKLANNSGFIATGVKANYQALMTEPLPVIAYINDSHYVVVNKITPQSVYLFDPSLGHIQVRREIFEQVWNGYLLLVRMQAIKKSLPDVISVQ